MLDACTSTACLHGNCASTPANAVDPETREDIINLLQIKYQDFNYAHARDSQENFQQITISRSTVERICKSIGFIDALPSPNKMRHLRKKPKDFYGEIIKIEAHLESLFATYLLIT